jgi:hypothetical protein
LAAAVVLGIGGVAHADNLVNDVVIDGNDTITTGGSTTVRYKINATGGDGQNGCNASDSTPAFVTLSVPAGVTASRLLLAFNACNVFQDVIFSSSKVGSHEISVERITDPGGGIYRNQADWTLKVNPPPNTKPSLSLLGVTDGAEYLIGTVPEAICQVTDAEDGNSTFPAELSDTPADGLGPQTATCNYTDGGGLAADPVSVTYTIVPPPNTKPSLSLKGVSDQATYEIGEVPAATCEVSDVEDGNSSFPAELSDTLSHGLGSQTATCEYTDEGGLAADPARATFTIVDTGDPTIEHSLDPADPNANDWYKTSVVVDFGCDDSGSGIKSCEGDTTLNDEGKDQSVTGTATDWAGNTATDTVSGINIDKTDPTVGFNGGPTGNYYFGNDPAAPTCDASDGLSGIASCEITGGGISVGHHSYTATAKDKAGNVATATLDYEVLAWTLKGFYQPVDMNGVWNTVKGGSTVPLKFEVFSGSTELTNTSSVKSFTQKTVACPGASAATDEIEIVSTGGTSLRYDSTAGQFIQNWQTPKKPGTCYTTTMTTQDGSTISANFILK